MDTASAVRFQARACADLGSPMYADLLTRVAADLERRGVCAEVLAGHEQDPGPSALGLRLLGSVHRLVLEGSAPELAPYYPSTGGTWEPGSGWLAFHDALRQHADAVRARLDQSPQTNEVGRAAALMGGLLHVGAARAVPVRLLEIGASAGLNLRADHFCYHDQHGRRYGRPDSPVQLPGAWAGRTLPTGVPEVVERLGCDVAPVDVSTDEGRLAAMSYVWPDHRERWTRLVHAFEVASHVPAGVRRQDARAFVDDLTLVEGTITVLWHSVMWQYLEPADQQTISAALQALGEQADGHRALAHLSLEPMRRSLGAAHEFLVSLRTWPGGQHRIIGSAAPHGLPTVWE
jgi:hypothetical protein